MTHISGNFNVVLISPEIPHNTGNIIRLCANVGARLHLVRPLGFQLQDPRLRRASLDYTDLTSIITHDSVEDFLQSRDTNNLYATTTKGNAVYTHPTYGLGDTILFGPESVGLPNDIVTLVKPENRLRIPMMPSNRSINLSNAVAIILYEMWRQIDFAHSSPKLDDRTNYFS